jgi:hypothetical protein
MSIVSGKISTTSRWRNDVIEDTSEPGMDEGDSVESAFREAANGRPGIDGLTHALHGVRLLESTFLRDITCR